MPWSSGLFSRLYNFVDDAAAGVKILASKQDAEWVNVVGGLNNVLCRDGQNSPITDINWAGHKITNLAPGTLPGDAATLAQTPNIDRGWDRTHATGMSYISPTQYKIAGLNQALFYQYGQRVWLNSPAIFGTVIGFTYVAPDSFVTIVVDGGGVIDPACTESIPGLLSNVNPSYLSPASAVLAYSDISSSSTPSPNTLIFPYSAIAGGLNSLGEFNISTYTFTARYPGVYTFSGTAALKPMTTVTNPGTAAWLVLNGTAVAPALNYGHVVGTLTTGFIISIPFSISVILDHGTTASISVGISGAGWITQLAGSSLSIIRMR